MTPTVIAEGVDCAGGPPTGAQLADAGYAYLAGYLRKREPSSVHVLTPEIVHDVTAAGLALVLLYEDTDPARMVTGGYSGGKVDAAQALADADQLGIALRAVYFCADTDVTADDFPAIDDYLKGAGSQLHPDQVGLYGERSLIEHVQTTGGARWFFQPSAWSNGIAGGVHIYQGDSATDRPLQRTVGGVTVDVDQALIADYGQWPAPAGPTTQGDDDMSAADVKAIEDHEDATIKHAVDEIRTDTAEGNSNANVRAHQDAQGNELADLFAYARQHFAALEDTVAAIVKHPALAAATINDEPAALLEVPASSSTAELEAAPAPTAGIVEPEKVR